MHDAGARRANARAGAVRTRDPDRVGEAAPDDGRASPDAGERASQCLAICIACVALSGSCSQRSRRRSVPVQQRRPVRVQSWSCSCQTWLQDPAETEDMPKYEAASLLSRSCWLHHPSTRLLWHYGDAGETSRPTKRRKGRRQERRRRRAYSCSTETLRGTPRAKTCGRYWIELHL
jgi:hypothetical protein